MFVNCKLTSEGVSHLKNSNRSRKYVWQCVRVNVLILLEKISFLNIYLFWQTSHCRGCSPTTNSRLNRRVSHLSNTSSRIWIGIVTSEYHQIFYQRILNEGRSLLKRIDFFQILFTKNRCKHFWWTLSTLRYVVRMFCLESKVRSSSHQVSPSFLLFGVVHKPGTFVNILGA